MNRTTPLACLLTASLLAACRNPNAWGKSGFARVDAATAALFRPVENWQQAFLPI
ncbi:MAG: hypothetical protein U0932_13580 [Thiobacillus sp.]|nr:hypothetical protein [Thiobacillus sp.]